MNFRKARNLIVLTTVALMGAWLLAQPGRGARHYDPSTEATVQGTVSTVTEIPGNRGWNGIHLSLQAANGTYEVHVGPSAYVSQRGFTFLKGDRIEVTGSVVALNGANSLIAREIKKDGKVLSLRDKQGFPAWSRAR